MSYGTIVHKLARALEGQIIAYSNLPHRGGCILYLSGPIKRIDIELGALSCNMEELAEFLRRLIADTKRPTYLVKVGMRDSALTVV